MEISLEKLLVEDEGLRLKPYRCTAGKLTIGVGRNLDDVGITEAEAMHLLANDIARVRQEVAKALPFVLGLTEQRQAVMLSMAFQMGTNGLLKFQKMLAAVKDGNYTEAAEQMKDSNWYKQTPQRCERLTRLMLG